MAERCPGFLNPHDFECTALLESSYPEIRRELMSVMKRGSWSRYVDHDQRRGRALLFLFYVKGRPNKRNCRLCPKTADVLSKIPGIRQAVFGFLPAGGHIAPHRGAPGILRVLLGVIAEPGTSGWKAEGETRDCVEGKVSIFDDGALHEAWNHGNAPRVVLICDPPASSNEEAARAALESYERRYNLSYLLRTYGKSRPPAHPYNRFALPLLLRLESLAVRLEPWLFPPMLFYYNHVIARDTPVTDAD
jgi:beta-hydroxylase